MKYLTKNGINYYKAKDVFSLLKLTWRNTCDSLRSRNIQDIHVRRGESLYNLKDSNIPINYCVYIDNIAFSKLLAMNTKLTQSEVNDIIIENNLSNFVYSERIEIKLLSIIESIIHNFDYPKSFDCIKQYKINDYRVDMYVPQLNLIIEIDEVAHNKKNDLLREDNIRSYIDGVIFFRVSEFNYVERIGDLVRCLGFDYDLCELDKNYINKTD
jgi:hypothetical protein